MSEQNKYNPLVSIVIPVYNGEKYVGCAIDSALNQTYKNIEVIVVNDGSQDNTDEIVKSYGDKVRYFSKENGGVATALNLAIKEAKGEYISWLSHDDFYFENKVQRQIDELNKIDEPKSKLLFSNYVAEKVEENTTLNINVSYAYPEESKENSIALLFSSVLHGCTLLVSKEAFDNVGYFNPELKTTQDYDLWFKFVKAGYVFRFIEEPLVQSRWHQEQDSKKKQDLCFSEKRALLKMATGLFAKDLLIMKKENYKVVKESLKIMGIKSVYKKNDFLRIFSFLYR